MNAIILCSAIAMNIFSMPAGNVVVGQTTLGQWVQVQDTSTLRDYVFVGEPGWDKTGYIGVKSMGWVAYNGLACNQ